LAVKNIVELLLCCFLNQEEFEVRQNTQAAKLTFHHREAIWCQLLQGGRVFEATVGERGQLAAPLLDSVT